MEKTTIRRLPIVLSFLLSFLAVPATAANLKATPAISLTETWDSNIQGTSSNEMSDFVFRANPKLRLTLETTYGAFNVEGGFEAEVYNHHTEFNETTATKNFGLTVTEPIRFSPRFSVLPSFRYVESVDSVRRNELTASPIQGLPPSETVVTTRTAVRDIAGSLQITYLLTPNVDLGIGGGGTKRQYLDNVTGLFNSTTWSGNVFVSYRITPTVSSGVFFIASETSYDGRPDTRAYTAGLAGTYRITERYTVDGAAGASYLRQTSITDNQATNQWYPYGHLSIGYASGGFATTLLGSYEVTGESSSGTSVERGNVSLLISNRFATRWTWDLSGGYQSNRSTDMPMTENTDTVSGSTGVRYQAAEWATLRLAGTLSRQWSHGIVGGDLSRGSVFFGIDMAHTYTIY